MVRCLCLLVLVSLTAPALADEPLNKLNLCSKTRQTAVIPADPGVLKAAAAGDVQAVSAALKSGVSPNATDGEGFSLLDTALTEHQDAVLDLLLRAGADVNQPFMGSSPLGLARTSSGGEAKDRERIAKLVKAGAVLSDFDEAFFTVIKLGFKSKSAGFIDAVTRGDMRRLELYARATYDINAPLADGISPLHVAAIQGTPEAFRYLVKCGANINARTKRGAPVFWFARNRPEITSILLELGVTEKE